MADHLDALKRQLIALEGSDKKEQCEGDLEGLDEVDLADTRYTFAQDFCIRVASIFANEYTPVEQIKQLLIKMAETKKKKELLSTTSRVFVEVYKNYLLKAQIRSAFDAYKREEVKSNNKKVVEARCIKAFTKISELSIKETIAKEFTSIFHKLEQDIIIKLARRFIHGHFIKAIEHSASLIRGNLELICDPGDDIQTTKVLGMAQYILENIHSIKNSLKQFLQVTHLSLVAVKPSIVQNRALVVESNEIDPFFKEYLLEILDLEHKLTQNDEQPGAGTQSEVGSWLAEHISIPHLISSIKQIEEQSIPSQTISFPREALSIVTHLEGDIPHSPLPSPRPENTREKMLIISARFRKCRCCSCRKSDEIAAMLDRFPLVEAVNDAGAIRASIIKYLRLYPESIKTVGPYLILIEGGAALIGMLTATDGIKNPNTTSLPVRIWKASTNGVVLLIFSLGASINIYLAMHPDKKNLSEETFYEELNSVPLFLMLSHGIWYSISPMQKERWFPRQTCYYALRKGIDVLSKSLYNAGVFLFAGITFFTIPKEVLYQILPLIPGTLVALGQTFTPYKEQLNTGMTYITFSVFSTMLFKDELPNSPDHAFEGLPHVIGRSVYLGGLTLYSFYLLIKNYYKFLEEYVNEEDEAEIIARRIQVPVVNGALDLSRFKDQGFVVNMDEYHRLTEDVEQGRVEEAQRKTLIFSQRRTLPMTKSIPSMDDSQAPNLSKPFVPNEANDAKESQPSNKTDEPKEQASRRRFCGNCNIL